MKKKHGSYVKKGDSLAVIHANDPLKLEEAKKRLIQSYTITTEKVEQQPVIKEVIV